MSYDLMVFDREAAPDGDAFLTWYEQQVAWSESHGYQDPAVTKPALQRWAEAMAAEGPRMEASFGREVVYACFGWSQADAAFATSLRLAQQLGVGFFDASGTGTTVWRPGGRSAFLVFSQTGGVGSNNTVFLGVDTIVAEVLPELTQQGDFVGLIDANDETLQAMLEPDGSFWLEIPDAERKGSWGTHLSRDELAAVFRQLPAFHDRASFRDFQFSPW